MDIDAKEIPLHDRHGSVVAYALVSEEDFDRLKQYFWSVDGRGYVQRNIKINGKRTILTMHRDVMGLGRGDRGMVDHINRVRLDNRRENLRVVDNATNKQNGGAHRDSNSRYVGVCWDRRKKKWHARASVRGNLILNKRFATELEAAEAYARARRSHLPDYVAQTDLE